MGTLAGRLVEVLARVLIGDLADTLAGAQAGMLMGPWSKHCWEYFLSDCRYLGVRIGWSPDQTSCGAATVSVYWGTGGCCIE